MADPEAGHEIVPAADPEIAPPSTDFREILTLIKRAGEVRVEELRELGNDNPTLQSLEVDRYTVGPRFFCYKSREREEVHKRKLANSLMVRTGEHLNLATRGMEIQFRAWEDEAFPQVRRYFNDDKDYNQFEYRNRGNFVVECLFIIEVIQRFTIIDVNDRAVGLSSIKLLLKARRDLIIYDNQLPFHVLEALFYLAFPIYKEEDPAHFLRLCVKFFSDCMLITQADQVIAHLQRQRAAKVEGAEIKDFIDLVRKCHAPLPSSKRQPPASNLDLTPMPKANYLEEAGMAIRVPPDPKEADMPKASVCSLGYKPGVLEIPKLRVNNKSRHLLRNLMEHEIQHYAHNTFITDYLHFMGSLIDTPADVDVLIHNGIIVNLLSNSNEVAALFNSITNEAPFIAKNYYYHGISADVHAYCQIPRHRWRAALKHDYCRTPWMVVSTIAAIALLLLTLVQTYAKLFPPFRCN